MHIFYMALHNQLIKIIKFDSESFATCCDHTVIFLCDGSKPLYSANKYIYVFDKCNQLIMRSRYQECEYNQYLSMIVARSDKENNLWIREYYVK